ncbi:cell division ATP-binding protein FtsE [Palleronia caenipelagi]|uniref:ATP-binding cassette domain-containing protein n=1 Tax=Palleronia caenipelagi TaxID=2489174 RepID=A0A547Q2V2_9RHOB|nr:ATP-binding cassette domain-containing protein [Palleronia caenipelagi]TRD20717.1 ATP-binding cassette domain-containing protein [Palleronia caenipelagi]
MIALEDVSYGFDGRLLFEGIGMTLAPGSFHFLTGASGAGKTTLLRLCYLDLLPQRGTITAFSKPAARLGRDGIAQLRRRVGVVHQDCAFLDHLSVRDNIALPLIAASVPPEQHGAAIDDLLHWVGLTERAAARPPELSGGEKQRAALARALILSPDVILADEPTGNLDWEMSLNILTLLVELNRLGKAVLVATHDLNLIRAAKSQVSARVLRLRQGQLDVAGAGL